MKKDNRLPYYILAALVFVALIWRVAHPPKAPIPGPLGAMPNWDSMTKVGDMGPWAVNPSGTMWAGAWNARSNDGEPRSAVWVVDFEKKTASSCEMEDGAYVSGLDWQDDKLVQVHTLDSEDPADAKKSRMVLVDATRGKVGAPTDLEKPVVRVLSRPPITAHATLAAQLADGRGKARIAVLDAVDLNSERSEVSVDVAESAHVGRVAAAGPKAEMVVFSVAEGQIGGNDTFYLADTKTGSAKQVFRAEDLPGRVEGLWVSPKGVLVVVSERDKFHRMVYDTASGKLAEVKPKAKIDMAASWPDAPKSMKFVTYNAGYDLDLETGAAKKLFDLSKHDRHTGWWREQVQDGRLYTRKDGGYTSVSAIANAIDIRIVDKDGAKMEPLLPRR